MPNSPHHPSLDPRFGCEWVEMGPSICIFKASLVILWYTIGFKHEEIDFRKGMCIASGKFGLDFVFS